MKKRYLIAPLLLAAPLTAFAQAGINSNPLVTFLQTIIVFIDQALVPLVFALALVAFLWGVFKYFIAGGANEEQRDKGKSFMLWAFIGLFVMVSVWGIVNLFTDSFGFNNVAPDVPSFGAPAGGGSGSDNSLFPSGSDDGKLADGASCVLGSQCRSGECFDFKCQAGLPPSAQNPNPADKRPNGSSCVRAAECQSNICFNFKCEAGTPTVAPGTNASDKLPAGASCVMASQCSSNICFSFQCQ